MSELHYIIELTEARYAELMRLVMRFGTGITADGQGTSVELRRALTEVEFKTRPGLVGEVAGDA